jgi:hypothetical protein
VFSGYFVDKDAPLDATERVIEAAKEAAVTQTHADIEAAKILAEAHRCEVADVINARSDGELRLHALRTSSYLIYAITAAQFYFSYIGKKLDIPDIIWLFVLCPWLGVGSSKLLDILNKCLIKK